MKFDVFLRKKLQDKQWIVDTLDINDCSAQYPKQCSYTLNMEAYFLWRKQNDRTATVKSKR